MKLLLEHKNIMTVYICFVLWFLIIVLLKQWAITPFFIFLTFLFLIFMPGYNLSRIFRINFDQDHLGQWILYVALGFIYNLTICFLIIIIGLTISAAIKFYLCLLILIFVLGLIFSLIRKEPLDDKSFSWATLRSHIRPQNLIYLVLIFFIILVLSVVDQLGTNFTGDPLGHLGIIRKVIENQPITMENLSYVKNEFHIAYGLPVWHVFLGIITKISGTNIFVLYREITTVLALLVFLVWYWLLRKILPTRSVAILALFLFILFHFGNNAYLYTRMPVPDTFNMLLLMPLCFGLALNYIFPSTKLGASSESNYKHLIILSLMLTLMGLIHWTQYFYWLSAMGLFAIFYLIFKFKDQDFSLIFKKIILSIFANMVLVAPLLFFLQSKSGIISSNIEAYSTVTKGSTNDRLYKFDPYFKLSYILLPLIVVFFRKYRRLIFILGVFLVGPIVYNIPWLYSMLRQYLSHVFVNRLYSNLGQWPYLIWAILIGFILVLIDRILAKIYSSRKYLRYIIDGLLGLFLIWMFFAQYQTGQIEKWYNAVFSNTLFNWLNANYYWLIPVVVLIALLIFIAQKYYPKLMEFFQFQEYKNYPTMFLLTLMVVVFLGVPAFSHLSYYPAKEFRNWHFFQKATDPLPDFINPDKFGGMEAIDFIKKNIPPKSVFDTNTFASDTLPTLVDVHMASLTFDPEPTKKYKDLYYFSVSIEKKLAMLKEGDIDYLIYQYQDNIYHSPFDAYPQYFIIIYDSSSAAIFQINKTAL